MSPPGLPLWNFSGMTVAIALFWAGAAQALSPQGCEVISRFDQSGFHYRPEVVYYFGARLPASASPDVYSQLEHTNFPTLYSATSPADDFAESFPSE